ncbi:hypothetical protein SAMN05216598_4343 [Pseudomonas asplenii]|uniref:Uncharacterized protein n=1 Tax=Pseudomonas asplenii TaxID=53407 RepID=A0A1H1YC54_9PSED|nr:hypothetical protein SAMN05216598_4343 [Pseudomonas asplenii]
MTADAPHALATLLPDDKTRQAFDTGCRGVRPGGLR